MTAPSEPALLRASTDPASPARVRGVPARIGPTIPRAGFLTWMDSHSNAPVRLICAGTGFGKTAAMHGWAHSHEELGTVIWVTVDSALTQRLSFWSYVLHQLVAVGVPLDADLLGTLRKPDAHTAFIPALLARQFEAAGPVVLVVDSADQVPEGAVVADLRRLAAHVADFQVVIALRAAEVWGDTTDDDLVATLPVTELLFHGDEISQFGESVGVPLTDSEATRILAASAGWPYAVRALLDDRRRGTEDRADAAAARIVEQFRPYAGFAALLVASLDEVAEPADLSALGFEASADAALQSVHDAGLGTWTDAAHTRFVVQPFLRDALRREFGASDPAARTDAHRRLALLRERRPGGSRSAFSHAIEAGDWPLTARIYRRHLLTLTGRAETTVLATKSIPARAQQAHPILRFATALDDYSNGRRARALQGFASMLAIAESRHLTRQGETLDDLWIQALVMVSLRLLGRHEMSRSALHRLEQMIQRADDPDGEIEEARAMLLTHEATTLVLAGHLAEAGELLESAGVDPLPARPPMERARVLGMRAMIAALRGDIRAAQDALTRRDALALPAGFDTTYPAVTAVVARALVLLESGEATAAAAALAHTDAHASTTELWPLLLHTRVLITWQLHGAPSAFSTLEDTVRDRESRGITGPFAARVIATLRVRTLLAVGRFAVAKETLAGAPQRRSRRWGTVRAQTELLAGDPQRAAALAVAGIAEVSAPRERLSLLVIAAAAALRIHDDEAAAEHTSAVIASARRHALLLPLTMVPRREAETILAEAPDLRALLDRLQGFPVDAGPTSTLSARESVVLRHLLSGTTVSAIAAALSVSTNTVKTQVRAIYRKLGVDNRADAIREARRRHLL